MKIERRGLGLFLHTTLGCTASCAHCLYSCSPTKAKYRMTSREMEHLIEDAYSAGLYSVDFTGGEPFLFPEDLFKAIAHARGFNMPISLRTNGFWAVSEKITRLAIHSFNLLGVGQIGLSYDEFHRKFVPLSNIKRIMRNCKEQNLSYWLDWVGRNASYEKVWKLFGDEYMPSIRGITPPEWVGRAKSLHRSYFVTYDLRKIEFDDCRSFRCESSGLISVYPGKMASLNSCCGGSPYRLKKIKGRYWITEIIKEAEASPARTFLYEHGVGGLIRRARIECPDRLRDWYNNGCDACLELMPSLFPDECEFVASSNYLYANNEYCNNRKKTDLMSKRLAQKLAGLLLC